MFMSQYKFRKKKSTTEDDKIIIRKQLVLQLAEFSVCRLQGQGIQ